MDFGKILDQWDELHGGSEVETIEEPETEEESAEDVRTAGTNRKKLRKMKPQAEVDLHGLTVEQAESVLDLFIRESFRDGLMKVQIIHGKGNHSTEQAVLPGIVRNYIEKSPQCGEFGYATGNEGGSGAVWVLLRQRSR